MYKMKKYLIWTVIILLVGLFAWKIAIPKYKLYKAIQYLDEEFHILKNKDEVTEVEIEAQPNRYLGQTEDRQPTSLERVISYNDAVYRIVIRYPSFSLPDSGHCGRVSYVF